MNVERQSSGAKALLQDIDVNKSFFVFLKKTQISVKPSLGKKSIAISKSKQMKFVR